MSEGQNVGDVSAVPNDKTKESTETKLKSKDDKKNQAASLATNDKEENLNRLQYSYSVPNSPHDAVSLSDDNYNYVCSYTLPNHRRNEYNVEGVWRSFSKYLNENGAISTTTPTTTSSATGAVPSTQFTQSITCSSLSLSSTGSFSPENSISFISSSEAAATSGNQTQSPFHFIQSDHQNHHDLKSSDTQELVGKGSSAKVILVPDAKVLQTQNNSHLSVSNGNHIRNKIGPLDNLFNKLSKPFSNNQRHNNGDVRRSPKTGLDSSSFSVSSPHHLSPSSALNSDKIGGDCSERSRTNSSHEDRGSAAMVGGSGSNSKSSNSSPRLNCKSEKNNVVTINRVASLSSFSTQALILEKRPGNLPNKDPKEERKHLEQYFALLEDQKRRQEHKRKQLQREFDLKCKFADDMSNLQLIWLNEIIPNWTDLRNSRRVREMWWLGVPPKVRCKLWPLVIGNCLNITKELFHSLNSKSTQLIDLFSNSCNNNNNNTLKVGQHKPSPPPPHKSTCALHTNTESVTNSEPRTSDNINNRCQCSHHPQLNSATGSEVTTTKQEQVREETTKQNDVTDDDEANAFTQQSLTSLADSPHPSSLSTSSEDVFGLIKLDVSRTFVRYKMFQQDPFYKESLQKLLAIFVCYRHDISYIQGMNNIAAVLLLNMELEAAFICFANLINRPILMNFFRLRLDKINHYYKLFNYFFHENLPKLSNHFSNIGLTPKFYLMQWILSLFSNALPLDISTRIWDLFISDGDSFLFRAALGLLKYLQCDLMKMNDFTEVAQFLNNKILAESSHEVVVDCDKLFSCIKSISLSKSKFRKFSEKINQDN